MASPSLPKWAERSGRACYDLEGAKQLKIFEATCKSCFESAEIYVAPKLVSQLKISEQLLIDCRTIGKEKSKAIASLQEISDKQSNAIEDLQEALEDASDYSVFGGALPWVIASLVASFSAGAIVGALK